MALTDLPTEVLYDIANSIHVQEDLGSLRQTCQLLNEICTPTLYRTTRIDPKPIVEEEEEEELVDDDIRQPWRRLARHDDLRLHIRHVTMAFNKHIHDTSGILDFFRLRFPAYATEASRHFPNLRSLNLRLASHVRGNGILRRQLYNAVAGVAACPIQSLTISMLSLLDAGADGRAMLDLRKFGIDRYPGVLQRLHLCFVRNDLRHLCDGRDSGRWNSHERNWVRKPKLLRRNWLRPNATFLTHLSLYCESYWGAFPLIVLDKIKFPKLKCLALGNYAFAQPSQLDAICSLQTLEMLLLDDCPILFLVLLYWWTVEKLDIETVHWENIKGADPDLYGAWTTKVSWAAYFDQIAEKLPQLRHFGFRPGDWTWSEFRPKAIEQHNEFAVDWHPQSRYTAYSALHDRWFEVMQKPPGREDKFFRVDLDKELNWRFRESFGSHLKSETPQVTDERVVKDKAALQRLLDVCQARAKAFEDNVTAQ